MSPKLSTCAEVIHKAKLLIVNELGAEKSYPHPLTLSGIFRIFKGEEGGLSAALIGSPDSGLKIL